VGVGDVPSNLGYGSGIL